jgi:hypothetical protein
MNTKTAAQAFEELRESGLLDSKVLNLSQHAKIGLGSLRTDIEFGHNSLSLSGKDEKAYVAIVEYLSHNDIKILGAMLNAHYSKPS